MKDGYYLSTYLHIDELAYCYNASSRHDHNCSLWLKKGNDVKLVCFWELERITGQKHHAHSFFNIDHAKSFINKLLAQYGLSLSDIIEVWGTPGLGNKENYYFSEDTKDLAYHNVAHLFSAILSDTEIFFNNPVIGLSLDGGPDNEVDDCHSTHKHFVGCYSVNGVINEYFSVFSPGPIWNAAKEEFGMEEGSLMALASATNCQYFGEDELVLCDDLQSTYKAIRYVHELIAEVVALTEEDIGIKFDGYDDSFTREECIISMVMKRIQPFIKTFLNIFLFVLFSLICSVVSAHILVQFPFR